MQPIRVSANFEAGHIKVVDCSDPANIRLELLRDNAADFKLSFYFRLTGARDKDCVIRIVNATIERRLPERLASIPDPFTGYRACATYDRKNWFRVDTEFDDTVLTIRVKPKANAIYLAHFPPYSLERTADLVAEVAAAPNTDVTVIGESVEGREIDLMQIGEAGPDKKKIWFLTRQHPVETQGPFFIEGMVRRLLDTGDPLVRHLLSKAVFYVAPCINPDGAFRGNTRTNAVGVNLNREWSDPSRDKAPEIFHLRNKMLEIGCDFMLDAHSDAELPYNWVVGPSGIPATQPHWDDLQERFRNAFMRANPDYRTGKPRPGSEKSDARLFMSWYWVAEQFRCFTILLELVYKDAEDMVDEVTGFTPQRCMALGRASLDALNAIIDDL